MGRREQKVMAGERRVGGGEGGRLRDRFRGVEGPGGERSAMTFLDGGQAKYSEVERLATVQPARVKERFGMFASVRKLKWHTF